MADREVYPELLVSIETEFELFSLRRITASVCGLSIWLALSASLAHAHGGMVGPDELGPPMAISGALAIAGYCFMLYWPFNRNRNKR
jgi:hypothetical protein